MRELGSSHRVLCNHLRTSVNLMCFPPFLLAHKTRDQSVASSAKIHKEFGGKSVAPKPHNSRTVYSEDGDIYKHCLLRKSSGRIARGPIALSNR